MQVVFSKCNWWFECDKLALYMNFIPGASLYLDLILEKKIEN